ncbi:hypothetical protein CFP65_3609 [Kitasatospora sp. MMS16-BH015]|uniref:hypothetical protein n=1 Tax=Kitasatospora sp. MMS16-BH015 TaxID=2018025 RepID=UPI000CA21A83|nr:hypothetical protein [Kitasatospora sp. MMS16-BH015]AUG78399.1 hypothetical protein CFP65_3609 [Kitasatospora sp. MMS16-BH015]
MHAVVVWWELDASPRTIEELRVFLREEAVDRFETQPGLVFKTWLADPAANRWGAALFWESAEAAKQPIPTRAAELIGYPPNSREAFDVEATVEGPHGLPGLSRLGLAYQLGN